MTQDEEVLAQYATEVEGKISQGKRIGAALDEVIDARLDKTMHPSDKLMVRDALLDILNKRKIDFVCRPRVDMTAIGGFHRGKYSFLDLAAGAECEDRNEQTHLEFPENSKNKGAA